MIRAKDLKYLAAYIAPSLAFIGVFVGSYWAWSALVFAFVIIPLAEPLFTANDSNYEASEKSERLSKPLFDILLYLNVPLIFTLLFFFVQRYLNGNYSNIETIGLVLSVGTVLGSCGINVAHELGHRNNKLEQFLAKLLLIPSLYMHFFLEHNRGHHKNIGTPADPATARFNEPLYLFWFRSSTGAYMNAWKLEKIRLKKNGISTVSYRNEMLIFQLIQLAYLVVIALSFGIDVMLILLVSGVFSFLLLESIKYIEHYGLQRKKLESGRFEVVRPKHSWNSNHQLGRIVLYELTRHSDHHFQADKKYQVLEHHTDSLQLPHGYPSSMLLAMFPTLWFKKMNRIIADQK